MKKCELVKLVSEKAEMSQRQAVKAIDALFEVLGESLEKHDRIPIQRFGTFHVVTRAARRGLNPRSKEYMELPALSYTRFSASTRLRKKVKSAPYSDVVAVTAA
jgi:DNA-binding protein HU-beta